jgi:hypothetical protein
MTLLLLRRIDSYNSIGKHELKGYLHYQFKLAGEPLAWYLTILIRSFTPLSFGSYHQHLPSQNRPLSYFLGQNIYQLPLRDRRISIRLSISFSDQNP